MKKFIVYFVFFSISFFSPLVFSHEPWLLTSYQLKILQLQPKPQVFSELGIFNLAVITFSLVFLLVWILFNLFFPLKVVNPLDKNNLVSFFLRLGTGIMLGLLSIGLIPKTGKHQFLGDALLAPEFLLMDISTKWNYLKWLELGLGIGLMIGFFTRILALFLLGLIITVYYLFGMELFQYLGFYLGIISYLLIQGGGKFAIVKNINSRSASPSSLKNSLLILQVLTGINFIFSAITMKFFNPNFTIAILKLNHAYTFGLTFENFTFLMLVTEVLFGILIVLGWRLKLVSIVLFFIFIFLSWNVSENLLAHSFIYGILAAFIITSGVPLFKLK